MKELEAKRQRTMFPEGAGGASDSIPPARGFGAPNRGFAAEGGAAANTNSESFFIYFLVFFLLNSPQAQRVA